VTSLPQIELPTAGELRPSTMPEAFQFTVARVPDRIALRTEGGAEQYTWAEYGEHVRRYAAGLAGLGLMRGDAVGLMTANGPQFNFLDMAAVHLGVVPVSIYATLPAADIAWILSDAGVHTVFAEAPFLPVLAEARALGQGLRRIVAIDGNAPGTVTMARVLADAPNGFDFEGAWRAVAPEDTVTISYTSGTTGPPKGVVLNSRSILGSIDALDAVMGTVDGARMVSLLPMAHVGERMFSHYRGIRFGMTVTGCPHPSLVAGFLAEVRPHYLFAPPRLFEKLRAAIEAKIAREPFGATARALAIGHQVVDLQQAGETVGTDLAAEFENARREHLTPMLAQLGLDKIVVAVTGSAPVPPGLVRHFLAMGLPALECWGMSECAAFGSINRPDDVRVGTVGYPLPGVEIRLAEDGEILLRSQYVMTGYLNRPELTAETIDADGWLHTGDIGAYDRGGRLMIVDRKKELIISSFGKNMSPANIEAKLKEGGPIIGQAAVIGDARPFNTALLVVDAEVAGAISDVTEPHELESHRVVAEAVAKAVAHANGRLSRVEQIKRYEIIPNEWLPGGDELSPTMKLKRKAIAAKYTDIIESMYGPM
jgi:long-chain acyl-CoA synthetase